MAAAAQRSLPDWSPDIFEVDDSVLVPPPSGMDLDAVLLDQPDGAGASGLLMDWTLDGSQLSSGVGPAGTEYVGPAG